MYIWIIKGNTTALDVDGNNLYMNIAVVNNHCRMAILKLILVRTFPSKRSEVFCFPISQLFTRLFQSSPFVSVSRKVINNWYNIWRPPEWSDLIYLPSFVISDSNSRMQIRIIYIRIVYAFHIVNMMSYISLRGKLFPASGGTCSFKCRHFS